MANYIDEYLFYRYFRQFRKFVEKQSNAQFLSFTSNAYTKSQEGYKAEVNIFANQKLDILKWRSDQIGKGKIIKRVISAIELPKNNLVAWQTKYGPSKRPHNIFFSKDIEIIYKLEKIFFELFHEINSDEEHFNELVRIVGKKYSLLAYLFFLKNKSKYLPIATETFDKSFAKLGVDVKTSHKCSWDNYKDFITVISELRTLLSSELDVEVSLLDAHSFAWIISRQMEQLEEFYNIKYDNCPELTAKEKEAVIKARVGQGFFRKSLIRYWNGCSVTGCENENLLTASHIKPWKLCDNKEAINPFNGLLLIPNLDQLFDKGYITFDNDGKIAISKQLDSIDQKVLNISESLKLRILDNEHKKYLEYHRKHIFKS